MKLLEPTQEVFSQLKLVLKNIRKEEYNARSESLSGSSIGQHVRHIVEFYQCLIQGYESGKINYDHRQRNKLIEENISYAENCIHEILSGIETKDLKRKLKMEIDYTFSGSEEVEMVDTTFERELVYNIEHSVHHMALIKIGVKELCNYIELPASFGVAVSTIKHQEKTHVYSHLPANC